MRAAGRSWLTLLACIAAAGGVRAQAIEPVDAPPELPLPAEAATGEVPAPSGRSWRSWPIAWTGSVSYDLRSSWGPGEGDALSHLVTGNLGLRSYIYQPWFATVSGSLGLTSGWSRTEDFLGAGSVSSAHEQIRSRERFLTGSARVDVFPRSRFPFEFHVERSDSRVDSGLFSSVDFQTQNIGFSQRYRPPNGRYTLSGAFDHREQSGRGFSHTQDALNADFGTRWKHNDLSVGLAHSRARDEDGSQQTRFSTLVGRHHYLPSSELSVNSTMNWTRNDDQFLDSAIDLSVLQLSSVGIYQRTGSPLTLTGSVRALVLREDVRGTGLETGGLTLGANYVVNRNLRLTATGNYVGTHREDGTSHSLGGSVGASWQGDSIELGKFRYDRFAGGSLGAALTSGGDGRETQTSLNLQLGHSVNRPWNLGPRSTLTFSASQSLAASESRASGLDLELDDRGRSTRLLMHSLSASWQGTGDNRTAYARASYNDSMELGGGSSRFQLLNFQISGNYALDNRRSFTGDLTLQRSNQRAGTLFADGLLLPGANTSSTSAGGEISYQHQRPFGVPRLRFVSRLKLAQDVLRQPGTLLGVPERETLLWDNRLDWSIGRLDTQLIVRFSQVDGRSRQALMLRVQRTFGN